MGWRYHELEHAEQRVACEREELRDRLKGEESRRKDQPRHMEVLPRGVGDGVGGGDEDNEAEQEK